MTLLGARRDGADLIAVKVNAGLVVWHQPDEYERLIRGVDMQAARAMRAELKEDA